MPMMSTWTAEQGGYPEKFDCAACGDPCIAGAISEGAPGRCYPHLFFCAKCAYDPSFLAELLALAIADADGPEPGMWANPVDPEEALRNFVEAFWKALAKARGPRREYPLA